MGVKDAGVRVISPSSLNSSIPLSFSPQNIYFLERYLFFSPHEQNAEKGKFT